MKRLTTFLTLAIGSIHLACASVNINSASKEELDAVKGISPAKAQAIVDYRSKNGPFKSLDELKQVKGFGEKSVAKLRNELSVSNDNGIAQAPAAKAAKK